MSQFSISGRVICGQRAAIPSEPFMRQGDLSHTRHPRVIDTLRQSRNHPPQQRKEGDLIVGSASGSAIATLVERTTRFVVLVHLPNGHSSAALHDGLISALDALPVLLRRSLTWDQGTELARHVDITKATGVPIFFCDPASPWQRGSNENTNGLLRQYFLKGTDLNAHSAQRLLEVATELNDRPRRILKRSTPADLLSELVSKKELAPVASTV
ncbi:IS30 family transposase [Cryobacterium melibiosiphilum]|uniref:IS30 family transposase n=1 Tax=Cryobacterium melibiosiphilum TaxID=995039 RepID=A0A3A5MLM2_9MICO|nr:IS30 family transposase [Cryobacterium melibiosiphilum]